MQPIPAADLGQRKRDCERLIKDFKCRPTPLLSITKIITGERPRIHFIRL